ncbi:hypothetical protein C8Q76DRAFT_167764 [Earliella scabrosa]|nr:hypothetical protein C8Q76DRAFT_167764 [Earliella scabrosa]
MAPTIVEIPGRRHGLGRNTNIHTPVPGTHRLPVELWMEIFSHLTGEDLAQCLRVCRHWREILLNMAAFWVDMLSAPLHVPETIPVARRKFLCNRFKTYLRRSGRSRPLTLHIAGMPQSLAEDLASCPRRIVSLTIAIDVRTLNEFERLRCLFATGMPAMEQFILNFREYGKIIPSLGSLDFSGLPRLRHLSVPRYVLGPMDCALDTLRTLEIKTMANQADRVETMAPYATTFQFLQQCPRLVSFSFKDEDSQMHPIIEEDLLDLRGRLAIPVKLQNLQRLAVDAKRDVSSILLSCIHCPVTTTYTIKTEGAIGRPPAWFTSALPRNLTSFPPIAGADALCLELARRTPPRLRTYTSGSLRLSMSYEHGWHDFYRHQPREVIMDLAEMFSRIPNNTVTYLTLSYSDSLPIDIHDWTLLSENFPRLVRLQAFSRDRPHWQLGLFALLHESSVDTGRPPAWPELEELGLLWDLDLYKDHTGSDLLYPQRLPRLRRPCEGAIEGDSGEGWAGWAAPRRGRKRDSNSSAGSLQLEETRFSTYPELSYGIDMAHHLANSLSSSLVRRATWGKALQSVTLHVKGTSERWRGQLQESLSRRLQNAVRKLVVADAKNIGGFNEFDP